MIERNETEAAPRKRATMPEASAIAIGQRLSMDGQIFTILRLDDCRRRDGTIRTLISWQAPCATCGETFYGTSTALGGMPARRCFSHRSNGRLVAPRAKHRRVSIAWLPPLQTEMAGAEHHSATGQDGV